MKKKDIKPLIMSALASLALGAVGTVGTFALFTDSAETTINIGAAEVKVKQSVEIQSVKELGNVGVSANSSGVYTNSIGGKTYIDSSNPNLLHLENWAPGDKVVLKVTNTNHSNVTIKTRFKVTHTYTSETDLWGALTKSYVATDAENHDIGYKYMDWSPVEPSVSKISDVLVTIEFPDHDAGQIRFGSDNLDNKYQNCNCSIVFTQEAVQGNAQTDGILDTLNAKLDAEAATEGRNKTMYDALEDVKTILDEEAIESAGYVWNVNEDHFFYGQENVTHDFFRVYSEMPTIQTNSIYATGNGWSTVALNGVGFDAGKTSGITSVSYTGVAETPRGNTIRTNSASTAVTINAPLDTVTHYGTAGSLNIVAVANSSYHENGKVLFAEIANGRIVLESAAQVSKIHLNATAGNFNDITVAKDTAVTMPAFSRDPVEIPEQGKLVVALQEGTAATAEKDYVWLTAVGIYEQVTVSNTDESAGTSYAAESDDNVQKTAAQQIANNISFTDGGEDYKVVATKTNTGWNYAVVESDSGDATTYQAAVVENTVVVTDSYSFNVPVTVDNGIDVEAKEAQKEAIVDEAVNQEQTEQFMDDYVARIGTVGYATVKAAFAAAHDGDRIVILKDADIGSSESTNDVIVVPEDISLSLNLAGHTLTSKVDFADNGYNYHDYDSQARAFYLEDGSSLTIDANGGKILTEEREFTEQNQGEWIFGLFSVYNATLTINGGQYSGGSYDDGGYFCSMIVLYGDYPQLIVNDAIVNYNNRFIVTIDDHEQLHPSITLNNNVVRTNCRAIDFANTAIVLTCTINGGKYEALNGKTMHLDSIDYSEASKFELNNVEVISHDWQAIDLAGAYTVINNCKVTSIFTDACPDDYQYRTNICAMFEAVVVINGGIYSSSYYNVTVLNSGGTVYVNDGIFTSLRSVYLGNTKKGYPVDIYIYGGTFNFTDEGAFVTDGGSVVHIPGLINNDTDPNPARFSQDMTEKENANHSHMIGTGYMTSAEGYSDNYYHIVAEPEQVELV